jgi:molecular chaperone HtpG
MHGQRHSHGVVPAISPELNIICAGSLSLVVFDPDGRFPISLQRDQMAKGKTGFENSLAVDVSEYFVNRLVETFEHLSPGITTENVQLSIQPHAPGLQRSSYRQDGLAFVILSKEGVLPADADIIRETGITSVLIDATNLSAGRGAFASPTIAAWADYYIAKDGITQTKVSRTDFIRGSIGGVNYKEDPIGYFVPMGIVGPRLLLRKSDVAELVKPGNISRTQWGWVSLEVDLDDWGLWFSGLIPELNLNLAAACAELASSGSFGITLLYFQSGHKSTSAAASQASPFAETWMRIVRSHILRQRPR